MMLGRGADVALGCTEAVCTGAATSAATIGPALFAPATNVATRHPPATTTAPADRATSVTYRYTTDASRSGR
ncbi:hypothetical protein ACFOYW_15470 [Gryllotalpicola reticulitermitis]|uniref:Uncharacterized protein n=1 Tax=Gryllotalpicola reticulitermitis TaxID=1184153 RepID=A0ABV8QAS3_9MICO